MVGLKICDFNGNEVGVTVSFAHNETIPKLHFFMDDERLDEMDAQGVFNLIKIAEANTNAIWQFDKTYDYDCVAEFDDGDVFIQKYCCDDETDNEYFVDLPNVQECVTECGKCPLCNYNPRKECRFHELYPRDE